MNKLFFSIVINLLFVSLFSQDILWEKTIGGDKSDYLYDIKPTPDFGFILAGSSLSDKSGNKGDEKQGDLDYFLWKMDEHGKEEWQRSFGGSGSDHLYCVNLTREGGYILGGSSNSPKSGDKGDENFGFDDFWVIKLNPAGEEEWQFTLGGKGMDILLSIQQTSDKGYILGGTSDSSSVPSYSLDLTPYAKSEASRGSMDFWVVKISEAGELEWQKTIGGKYYDVLRSIHQTQDNGYILGGYSNSMASGEKSEDNHAGDYWIVKLNEEGIIEWDKTIGGDKDDELFTLFSTKNGYLLGGSSNSGISKQKQVSNINGTDWWIVQIDEQGDIQWQKTYDISKNDLLVDITPSPDGNYLLSGYAKTERHNEFEDEGIEDYYIIKIDTEGKELWRKSIGGKGSDRLQGTTKTRDGGYILAGTSDSGADRDKGAKNQGRDDYWIVKLLDKDTELKTDVQKLEIYPNPAEDFINILIHEDFKEADLQIVDMIGALVLQQKIKNKITPIDIRQLQTGSYIVTITTKNQTFNAKLLKR